jgi:2-aminoethylphosphonate-pyruvate transaminase
MVELGFKTYIDSKVQGCIITTFLQPTHKNFVFTEFYDHLASKNLVIYPGKLTVAETFRIGSIGEIYQ